MGQPRHRRNRLGRFGEALPGKRPNRRSGPCPVKASRKFSVKPEPPGRASWTACYHGRFFFARLINKTIDNPCNAVSKYHGPEISAGRSLKIKAELSKKTKRYKLRTEN